MLQTISLWLHESEAGKFLLTMLISMTPVAELRVGVPAGVAMGLSIPLALLAGIVGNMLPVPFVILFIRRVFKWVRIHIPRLGGVVDRLERRAYEKIQNKSLVRYEAWGLLLFVAIPLPGTGGWTGSLFAALLNIDFKKAFPIIALGILIAEIIMFVLVYVIGGAFAQYFLGSEATSAAVESTAAFIAQALPLAG